MRERWSEGAREREGKKGRRGEELRERWSDKATKRGGEDNN